jgi:hypothetical protein
MRELAMGVVLIVGLIIHVMFYTGESNEVDVNLATSELDGSNSLRH